MTAGSHGASARFTCLLCGREAGAIELSGSPQDGEIRRASVTSVLTQPVTSDAYRKIRAALRSATPRALFEVDPELVPCFCPTCDASYCGDHWTRWDVFDEDVPAWHDSIRGSCPRGHERMLED